MAICIEASTWNPSYKRRAMRSSRWRMTVKSYYGTRRPSEFSGSRQRDAIGQSLDLIIPERFRERHWNGFHQVMLSGHSRYGTEVLRVPALHKDGRALSIAFTVALVNSSDSQSSSIVAIVRDETQRWNEERELRRRVAELERPT